MVAIGRGCVHWLVRTRGLKKRTSAKTRYSLTSWDMAGGYLGVGIGYAHKLRTRAVTPGWPWGGFRLSRFPNFLSMVCRHFGLAWYSYISDHGDVLITMMAKLISSLCALAVIGRHASATPAGGGTTVQMAPAAPGSCSYPANCPMKVLPRPDTQSWQMNKS